MSPIPFMILAVPFSNESARFDEDVKGISDEWLLMRGKKMGDHFPTDAVWPISKRKGGTKLNDFVPNIFSRLVVSSRARERIQAKQANIEWLPVKILDRKGKPAHSTYFIANVLEHHDCINRKKSRFEVDPMSRGQIQFFTKVVLETKKIPDQVVLFRMGEAKTHYVIRSTFALELAEAGLTGFDVLDPEEITLL